MRKTLGAIALLLLLTIGVAVNALLPSPNAKAREAVGNRLTYKNSTPRYVSYHSESSTSPRKGTVILAANLGRQASDFNELVLSINSAGFKTIAIEAPGINGADMINLESEYSTPLSRMTMPIF